MSAAGWIAIIVVVLILYGLAQLGRPREISDEEFEREAKRGGSLLGTGLQELQAFFDPSKRVAIEAVEEEKRKTNQEVAGDPPKTGNRERSK